MASKKTRSNRSKSTSNTPFRSSSMYDFHRAQNQFLPTSPGYFPYMLPPWPMNYMYMDYFRPMSMDRFPEEGEEDWAAGNGRSASGRHDRKQTFRGRLEHPGIAWSPFRPQFGGRRHQLRPLIETSSSGESLTPCNSCKCCRFYAESCSMLDFVCRGYHNDRLRGQHCKGRHHHKHVHSAASDVPSRERPTNKKQKVKIETRHEHSSSDEPEKRVKNKRDKTNQAEAEDERETSSEEKSKRESPREFIGGTGDERVIFNAQTKMPAKKKPRPKSTAYFLPLNYS